MGFLLGVIVGIAMIWLYFMLYVKSRIQVLQSMREVSMSHGRVAEANEYEARIIELREMKFGLSSE